MNDTVQKLMGLAREWANAVAAVDTATVETNAAEVARIALQDELTRLFTPLSDEQIAVLQFEHLGRTMWFTEIVRAIEHRRGIGERNEQ